MIDQENDDIGSDEEDKENLKLGVTAAVIIWGLALIVGLAVLSIGNGPLGSQLGDMFNVINALFSSIAVAGAIYAVILQQRELKLTRKEFKGSREAQESTAIANTRMAAIQAFSALLAHSNEEGKRLHPLHDKLVSYIREVQKAKQITDRSGLPSNIEDLLERAADFDLTVPQHHVPFKDHRLAYIGSMQVTLEGLLEDAGAQEVQLSRRRSEVSDEAQRQYSSLTRLLTEL